MWLVAFLAGFSDRFCDFTLNRIFGRLNGTGVEPHDAQQAVAAHAPAPRANRTFEMLDEMSMDRGRPMPVDYPAVPAASAPVAESRAKPRDEVPMPPPHQRAPEKPAAKGKNGKD